MSMAEATTTPTFPGKGQRQEGLLRAELPLLGGLSWPYIAISGAQDGPRIAITAGVHGCEYVSIRAAQRLGQELDPNEVRGQVLVVPVVNLPTFWERSAFFTPQDGKNLNRQFPGSARGTFSEQLAYFISQTVIEPSQAFLDLHGGDMVEQLLPFAGYLTDAEAQVSETSKKMAEAFGLPWSLGRRGAVRGQGATSYVAAALAGVPALLAEAGGNGLLTQPDVDLLVAGSRRVLQVTGNLPGEPEFPGTRFSERSETLLAPQSGFWESPLTAGDEVRSGQEVGRLLDLYGNQQQTITAPFDATVLYRTTSSAVKEGGILISLVA